MRFLPFLMLGYGAALGLILPQAAPPGIGQKFYTGGVTSQETTSISEEDLRLRQTGQYVTEDYRSDRAILEELSAELARVHRRLDSYETLYNRWRMNPFNMLGRIVGQLGRPHA